MKLADQLRVFHDAMVGTAPIADAAPAIRDDGIDRELRLRVYANAYLSRIGGVLEQHYPKLRTLLGDAAFRPLVRDYLRAHPPSDPSLREAGANLPQFLFYTPARDYLHLDLARLERARVEAFDGPDAKVLARDDVAALPPEEFPSLRVRLVPTAKLVGLTANADEVWDAIEDGQPVPAKREVSRTVLVWRRDITVIHRVLEEDEESLLHLVHRGGTFAHLCQLLAGRADATERAIELLLRWLDAEILAA